MAIFNQRDHEKWCDQRDDLIHQLQTAVEISMLPMDPVTVPIAMPCDRDSLLFLLEHVLPRGNQVEWTTLPDGDLDVWVGADDDGEPHWRLRVTLNDDQD